MSLDENRLFEGVLLLSDMDGTMLNLKKELPQRNLDALQEFKRRGGLFTIATGRCPLSVRNIFPVEELNCPAVTLNGTVIYDYRTDTPVVSHLLPESYQHIVRIVREEFPHLGIQLYIGSQILLAGIDDVVIRQMTIERLPYTPELITEFPARVNKVLFGGANADLQRVRRRLKSVVTQDMYGIFTEDCYYEIFPAHAHKGNGAHTVAEILGVAPSRVAAVGDYYNDVDMLKAVAYPMVAGNAPDDVKMHARFVAGHCDGGAVADAIEHMGELLLRQGSFQHG